MKLNREVPTLPGRPTCTKSQTDVSVAEPVALPVAAPIDNPEESFGCALWNNGVLMLSVDGQLVELSPERTRELARYLQRMAETAA